jgi:hypothetical protein
VLEQSPQRPKRSKMWHDWFRKRIADNTPYDEIVKGVLTATSRDGQSIEDWVKQTMAIEQQAIAGWETDYAKRKSLDLFWRRQNFPIQQIGEHTAAAFLGIRLECAQCHKHPFDRWTQDDYRSYAHIFAGLRFVQSSEAQKMLASQQVEMRKKMAEALAVLEKEFAEKKKPIEEKINEEYAARRKPLEDKVEKEIAEKKQMVEERVSKEPEAKRKAAMDKFERDSLSLRKRALGGIDNEIKTKKQQAFAKIDIELAQRRKYLQARYRFQGGQFREVVFGTPQPPPRTNPRVQPPPPPTPKALGGPEINTEGDPRAALFEWMRSPENPYFARSFVNRVWGHYFGIGIVHPVDNFSIANPASNDRLLDELAKVFIDSNYDIRKLERSILLSRTYQLTAMPTESNRHDRNNFARSYPRRLMAEQVVDVLNTALGVTESFGNEVPPGIRAIEIAPSRLQQNQNVMNLFRLFGRPTRSATCDCERPTEPALPQTLFLMTDPVLLKKITDGRLKELLASKKSDEELVEELVLATLSRLPSQREKTRLLEYVQGKATRQTAFVDVVWALINTREFILNH